MRVPAPGSNDLTEAFSGSRRLFSASPDGVYAVDGMSSRENVAEAMSLVGESGCGQVDGGERPASSTSPPRPVVLDGQMYRQSFIRRLAQMRRASRWCQDRSPVSIEDAPYCAP